MNLCTCVSQEGGDGEGEVSEESSLLSYTLRYVSVETKWANPSCHGKRCELITFSRRG